MANGATFPTALGITKVIRFGSGWINQGDKYVFEWSKASVDCYVTTNDCLR